MYQFFVEPSQIQGNRIVITGSDVNHIKNVLRMKPGEEIAVSNGTDGKEYRCGIEELLEEEVICTLRFIKEDGLELPARVTFFQGLPKADKMEFIVQKLVELGAYRIVPVALKRSVVHLDEKKAKARQARWQSIAEAAAKQSKRRIVPEVGAVCTLKEALEQTKQMDLKLIPYELSEGMMRTRKLIESAAPGQEIGVFIGPEGGFEEAEVELAMQSGFMPVTLGKRILRTETAGLTVMAWLMYQLEDSGISYSRERFAPVATGFKRIFSRFWKKQVKGYGMLSGQLGYNAVSGQRGSADGRDFMYGLRKSVQFAS